MYELHERQIWSAMKKGWLIFYKSPNIIPVGIKRLLLNDSANFHVLPEELDYVLNSEYEIFKFLLWLVGL